MKKMLVIIVILLIIFIIMVINQKQIKQKNITVQEVEKIEQYIAKIYMWKEVTKEALPYFQDINEVDEQWLWEVVKRDIEEYEVKYEEIKEKAKELFGETLKKEFPKEGNNSYEYNEETGGYIATEVNLDAQNDSFLLLDIKSGKEEYVVEIAEYIIDYSDEENIKVRNLEGEEVQKMKIQSENDESKVKDIVKQNITRFSKKKIYLKQGENLEVKKVEKVN